MLSFNSKARSAFLAIALIVSGQASAAFSLAAITSTMPALPAMPKWIPSKKQVALALFAAGVIRLYTKPTYDYKASEWKDDLKDLMESLNIFDSALYAKLVNLIDKWIIGRKISLLDVTLRSEREDGVIEAAKDKKLKAKPFGALGLVDAYFLIQLEKLNKFQEQFDKASGYYSTYR